MTSRQFKIRGLRGGIPGGYVIGRTGNGKGDAQLIPMTDLAQQIVSVGGSGGGGAGSSVVAGIGISVSVSGSAYTVTNTKVTLASLTDVAISGPVDGQSLNWDVASGKWINSFSTSDASWHGACVVVATTALPGSPTYSNGSSGVGATLTATSNAALVVDGATAGTASLGTGNRVLVVGQADTKQNGIYVLTQDGDGSHPYILTRATDFDGNSLGDIQVGLCVAIPGGTTHDVEIWMFTGGTPSPLVIGTSTIVFTRVTGINLAGAGGGLFGQIMSATPSQASTGLSNWVNQGSSTTRDGATGLVISLPGVAGNTFRALSKSLTAPYTISALFCLTSAAQNFFGGGIGWVDTVNSKAHVIALIRNGDAQVNVERWTNFSTIGSNDTSNGNNETALIWLQIQNDGTNITFRFSRDGDNWVDAHTETLAGSYMGATNYGKVCFFLNPSQQSGTGATCKAVLMSWKEA